jgi:hypothetical protein
MIVSANVGGQVAGGVVIPEAITPSYATYPDVADKSTADLKQILLANLNKLLGGEVSNIVGDVNAPASAVSSNPVPKSSPWLMVAAVAVGVLAVVYLMR